jgi:hypothetical protein
MVELATFRPDDEPCLVAASLACRRCLSGSVEWSLRGPVSEPRVECRCRDCGYARTVELTGAQELRLSLDRERVEQAAA